MKIINFWRYSHFSLAGSFSLFILVAALTGIILSFEPIDTKLQAYYVPKSENIVLADLITTLHQKYSGILSVEVDGNGFISISVFSWDGDDALNGDFYIDPYTGNKIGEIRPQKPIYAFATNLHRSLFLGTIGRLFVGVASFILLLIVTSGSILLIKRQGGISKIFSKVFYEKPTQYGHVTLARLFFVPIVVIAFSGVYLSVLRFGIISDGEPISVVNTNTLEKHLASTPVNQFDIFTQTTLGDVRHLEFPFSADTTDYFTLQLHKHQFYIHQYNGAVIEQKKYSIISATSSTIFNLHTGYGSIFWSIILGASSLSILYFLYSGTHISIQRLRASLQNVIAAKDAEYVVLVGSENGSTKHFGKLFQQQLLNENCKVFIDDLNKVQHYPHLKQLVIFTSTYGDGEPPANAQLFINKWKELGLSKPFQYSVVGFGSRYYSKFCGFAYEVQHVLSQSNAGSEFKDICLIHNQSHVVFQQWATEWGNSQGLQVKIPQAKKKDEQKMQSFKVLASEHVDDGHDYTFTLRLQTKEKYTFESGDLLGIYPAEEDVKREYSIGKTCNNEVLLSIKKHEHGLCSTYLSTLKVGDHLKAEVIQNKSFHLPPKKAIIMIANGTGIAPFLGMLQQAKNEVYLYWGGRTQKAYQLYAPEIENAQVEGKLKKLSLGFSKEAGVDSRYVQDLLQGDSELIFSLLCKEGSVMICGSVAMQNGVMKQIQEICLQHNGQLSNFKNNGQFLADCY